MGAYCSSKCFIFKVDQRLASRLSVQTTPRKITFVLAPPDEGSLDFESFGFLDGNNRPLPPTVSQGVPEGEDKYTFEIWPWKRDGNPASPGASDDGDDV